MILSVLIAAFMMHGADTLLSPSVVTAVKEPLEIGAGLPYRSSFYMKEIESSALESPKDFSSIVPNLHIPDYGSAMTSTIYFRGFGSRMENPVMGLYIDDIPVLDKNAYDFDFLDIRSVEVLRGPQGTLYGRNSMMGVMSVTTLSPALWQGTRGSVEYGTGNSISLRTSTYSGDLGIAAAFRHLDGYYKNEYTGELCDPYDGASLRLRYGRQLSSDVAMDNIISASWTDQGGYPYRQISRGEKLPVHYNDRSAYRRLHVTDGLRLLISAGRLDVKSVTSLQMFADRMDMDQDFTSASMFTLSQRQRQAALTEEVTITPQQQDERWRRRTGAFAFVKFNDMSAPVTFKQDGIDKLILSNANANIPDYLGKLTLDESQFLIGSHFDILCFNLAAYHESVFVLDDWQIVAGLRADLELDGMDYASDATVHFRLVPAMAESYPCETLYSGRVPNRSFQLLPKLSVLRSFESDGLTAELVLSWAEGYRAGGFNTQLFSDILQNKMMTRMMSLCGVHLDGVGETSADNTVYKPEFSDNFELGGFVSWHSGEMTLNASADVFFIVGRNQQLTVFPAGMSTGRMMTNVGRSRSSGFETAASLTWKDLRLDASYGFTDARFTRYDDGNHDYSGNRIPYSPRNTLSLRAGYKLGKLSLSTDLRGVGDIYWNEDNSLRQPLYFILGGGIRYDGDRFGIYLRGENLSGREVPVFWFKSVGNEFFQMSHPATVALGIDFSILKK